MQKIIVSVTNDLTTDQRIHKVCMSLQKMGFEILLVGRKLENSLPLDRNYKTHRIDLFFNKRFLFYAEYNIRIFFYILFKKKDILLANDLDTLLPNYLIHKIQNKKLVYDSHELFTELPELVNRPKTQKVWSKIESSILPKLKNTYTVCQSIANYYNKKYKTNFKVIRNVPYAKPQQSNHNQLTINSKQIILYQGAINIGRGLELMIDTMQYLDNYQFLIIGDGDILTDLQEQVKQKKLQNRITFLGKITPSELKKMTPTAHLGISIEEDLGLSYRYALPNKIFDYIHATVPVLVSNLPEMKSIVETHKIGEIVTNRNPKSMANQIKKMLQSDLTSIKKNLKKTAKKLNWENEEKTLQNIFNKLI